jgi:3-methyl-2-oxobutanoate hydroxymethyltransferase
MSVTLEEIRASKGRERLVMLTAYDFSLATLVDQAGVDMVLIGDSLGMVVQGLENTTQVTVDEVVYHTRAVARGVTRALLIADLPKEALDAAVELTVRSAQQLIAAGAAAVKIEWRDNALQVVRALVAAHIPVMGHIGLTPQSVEDPVGFRVQGRTADAAVALVQSAHDLQAAGCFSLVLECIPSVVADIITEGIAIPTIGIGAGPGCNGQVLVLHDMLGLYPRFSPKFVKKYTDLSQTAVSAMQSFAAEVRSGTFPTVGESFSMQVDEAAALRQRLRDWHATRAE